MRCWPPSPRLCFVEPRQQRVLRGSCARSPERFLPLLSLYSSVMLFAPPPSARGERKNHKTTHTNPKEINKPHKKYTNKPRQTAGWTHSSAALQNLKFCLSLHSCSSAWRLLTHKSQIKYLLQKANPQIISSFFKTPETKCGSEVLASNNLFGDTRVAKPGCSF